MQKCVQKMQTKQQKMQMLMRLLLEQSYLGLHCLVQTCLSEKFNRIIAVNLPARKQIAEMI